MIEIDVILEKDYYSYIIYKAFQYLNSSFSFTQ